MQTNVSSTSVVVVTDGTEDIQRWVDSVIEAARAGTPGDWPHPHPNIPAATITVGTLIKLIQPNFASTSGPWSIVDSGFPPLPGGSVSLEAAAIDSGGVAVARDPGPEDEPNRGSAYHNLLHGLLGDFH
jgi:hypothetical protein